MPSFIRTQHVEHEVGDHGVFGLRVTSADVELRGGDGPVASAHATFELRAASEDEADEIFERVRLRVSQAPGRLELEEPRHAHGGLAAIARLAGIGAGSLNYRVEATVPRAAELRFDGVSSDVTVDGMCGRQDYRTVSGDLFMTDAAGEVRTTSVSGDVGVRAVAAMDLRGSSVSGDLSVLGPRFGHLHVNTVSGDVEVEGELAADASHQVETVSGDLSIGVAGGVTLEVRGISSDAHVALPHRSEGSPDRRRFVVGDGAASVTFRSMSGDARLGAPRRGTPPAPPGAPVPPVPPAAPLPPTPDAAASPTSPSGAERLEILRAVERGEIDVDEAARRLASAANDD